MATISALRPSTGTERELLFCSTDLQPAGPNLAQYKVHGYFRCAKDDAHPATSFRGYRAGMKPATLASLWQGLKHPFCVILLLATSVLPWLVKGWLGCAHTLKIQAQRDIRQGYRHPRILCSQSPSLLKILLDISVELKEKSPKHGQAGEHPSLC